MRKTRNPLWGLILLAALPFGCATAPPSNIDNICVIFQEHPQWYREARASEEKWQVPIPILMSIIHQESGFRSRVRPARTKILGFIPGPRPSSAYGYPQAINSTWETYQRATANPSASRTRFKDAVDFVGWYCQQSHSRCGISRRDPYQLYLAYHEGHGGYQRRTYQSKTGVLTAARKVEERTKRFRRQLEDCRSSLEKPRRRFLGLF